LLNSVSLLFVLPSAIAFSQSLPQPLPLPHPEHEKYNAEVARIDAAQMIGAGKLTILGAGLPPPCEYLLQQKIYRRYGILWTTTGDVVTDGFEDYRESFNEVMVRHISRQRGEDFLASLDEKVAVEVHLKCAPRSRNS